MTERFGCRSEVPRRRETENLRHFVLKNTRPSVLGADLITGKKRHTFHLDASGQHAGPASRPVGPKAEVSPHRRISHHCTVIYSAIQGKRFFGLFELTRQKKTKPSCSTSYKRLARFGARPSRWHTRAPFARFRNSSCLINNQPPTLLCHCPPATTYCELAGLARSVCVEVMHGGFNY